MADEKKKAPSARNLTVREALEAFGLDDFRFDESPAGLHRRGPVLSFGDPQRPAMGHPDSAVLLMDLYCWHHNQTHSVTAGQVERIVYALTGAYADALTESAPVFAGEASDGHLECPFEVLRWAHDGEMYAEHCEQGVECRHDSEASRV